MALHDWVSLMLGGAGFGLAAWRRCEIIFLDKGARNGDKARS